MTLGCCISLTFVLGTEENRKLSPLVDEDTWNTLLTKTGFNGTELVLRDYENESCHEMSFLVSKAMDERSRSVESSSNPRYKLIVEKDSALQQGLAETLQNHGNSENCICDILTIQEAAEIPSLREYACIFVPELERPLLTSMGEETYNALKTFLLASSHILWLTKGGGEHLKDPAYVVIDGFARSFRLEANNVKLVSLALQDEGVLSFEQLKTIFQVMKKTLQSPIEDYEREYIEKNGMLHTNRIVEANNLKADFLDRLAQHKADEVVAEVTPVLMDIESPGQLDTLYFTKDTDTKYAPNSNEVEIEVKAIELGFVDYSVATGRSKESKLGSGCCGIVLKDTPELDFHAGDRVWMHGSGLCKTVARSPAALVTKLPIDLSFEQVCGLPPGLLSVCYAMHQAARIRKDDSILVRCSKLYLEAALQMAIAADVNVYIVAEDETTKEILSRTNRIPDSHILSGPRFSRSLKRLTGGRGVDVILNSFDWDISQCFESLSPYGTFVDIVDHRESIINLRNHNANLNVTTITVNSALMVKERPQMLSPIMEKVVSLAAAGTLKPSTDVKTYPLSQAKIAFEDLGAKKEGAKVVLSVDMEDTITVR